MTPRLFRDALNAALQKLTFPWLTPHPTSTGRETGYFQKTIKESDLYEMYKRNQLAHNIVYAVAHDALAGEFTVCDSTGEVLEKLNEQVQNLYAQMIFQPLLKCLIFARLYGSAGILIGYRDPRSFEHPANPKNKIDYLFAIPHGWVAAKVAATDDAGNVTIPAQLAYYELSTPSIKIHASRIIHLQPLSIEENFEGESCLIPLFDALTILKNLDWATGQTMFRHGAGLTTVVAGENANQEQIDAIDAVVTEINSKTVITLPPGCTVETHRPGALDPEKFYTVICNQIAGGANIPVSILLGAQKGAVEAASKDRKDYADMLLTIQKTVLAPALTAIVKRFQASGQLPPAEFLLNWSSPAIFLLDVARGRLYDARAETEAAKAERERAQAELIRAQAAALNAGEEEGEGEEEAEPEEASPNE
ncbi:MAG TPA: DUF1073 domain-containing protein [Methanomicrobia archaeon]|nr:DUF1073 domain-containing protein [Methanomicrobia archaeon]